MNNKLKTISKILAVSVIIGGIALVFIKIDNLEKQVKSLEKINVLGVTTQKEEENSVEFSDRDRWNVDEVEEYYASALQIGGIDSKFVQVQAEAFLPNDYMSGGYEHGYIFPYEDWAITTFNRGGDVLWLSCRDKYSISSCTSSSNNRVHTDDVSGCAMSIENKMQNRVEIKCVREY